MIASPISMKSEFPTSGKNNNSDVSEETLSSAHPAALSALSWCAPHRSGGASETIAIELEVRSLTLGEMVNVVDEIIQIVAKTRHATNKVIADANHRRILVCSCSVARIA